LQTVSIDLSRGPVLAAARTGPGRLCVRTPADLVLVSPRRFGLASYAWVAAGKAAPLPSPAVYAHYAPLEAFDVTVFVRFDVRELVIARTGPGRPDCRWVLAEDVATDTLTVAAPLWEDVLAALDRQLPAFAGACLPPVKRDGPAGRRA
jgi:hypothetical protein